jgi:hypothetical protein
MEARSVSNETAAPDRPMVITKASYAAGNVTVEWVKVAYAGCNGYVLGIFTGSTQLNNFQSDQPAATSMTVPFTCNEGIVYTTLIEPIIRQQPSAKLCSDPVTIPYPAT